MKIIHLAAILTLGACSATSMQPVANSFAWQAPGEFHFQAFYRSSMVDKSDNEAQRVEWLEEWVVNEGGCTGGYVVDKTAIIAEGSLERKHYWGHCTS